MHYAVSDINGLWDKYEELLARIAFGPEDVLYVLGNVLGRGPEGLRILHDLSLRSNARVLLGNQEFAAMICLPWLQEELSADGTRDDVLAARLQQVLSWKSDGGAAVMEEFTRLSLAGRQLALDELSRLERTAEVACGGSRFVLVHANLENFAPDRPLGDYGIGELIQGKPDVGGQYFEDRYLVFGHTPTPLLYEQELIGEGGPQIFRKDKLIGLNCGCVYGGRLGCICLDTFAEYYV